ITAFIGVAVNLGVSLISVRSIGAYGLALGTVAAAVVMAVLLLIFTARVTPGVLTRALLLGILREIVAAMALFITARELRIIIEKAVSGTLGSVLGLAAGFAAGIVAYVLVLWLTGSKELKSLKNKVK
ncbi:MAG: polysaccharide biosynthesis C-terminal domain-containing protein, partial [Clostridia bacterium]|nr:polysaccharide biosynthesis C-terminal domain-containing protein [Clostridia bacterium]